MVMIIFSWNEILNTWWHVNSAPKTFKPKPMDRKTKAFTGSYPVHLLPGSNFQAKKHPPQKALCAKIYYSKIVHGGNHVRK